MSIFISSSEYKIYYYQAKVKKIWPKMFLDEFRIATFISYRPRSWKDVEVGKFCSYMKTFYFLDLSNYHLNN